LIEKKNTTLQSVILTLQEYWAEEGCVIWQPYHTEVGAGTMNPATFLRVLGPEPWWVAYVEPSIRPADGRYGENPNRWQHYYQFQVILKPDPGDPLERYLNSLLALGIDPAQHDIRFVEDNWVSPVLGAWGLGWEVWLDGQEITQYTYFQQAGGQTLEPVSVEITYGLERIVLALHGLESFLDIRWNEQLSYGDLNLRGEQEFSRYNFEYADIERLRTMYNEYESEAEACLEAGLVLPAHDYILKCSHVFNLLDSRGAVGVTERAALFGRMRDLSRRAAEVYLEQRESLGFPWMGRWDVPEAEAVPAAADAPQPTGPAPFLLEIGTEELPVGDLDSALMQLEPALKAMLDENRLAYDGIHVSGTPRRVVAYIEELAAKQIEEISVVKGPPAERAFDDNGEPTKAAVGFARSKGIPAEALQIQELDGGRYVVAEVRKPGLSADEVLTQALPALIAGLRFDKTMHWNASGVAFSRPIRWLLALHGEHVVPFDYAGLTSGRITHLLRFSEGEVCEVANPQVYFQAMEGQGIVLDVETRKAVIQDQITRLAQEVEGEIEEDPSLLGEVTNLVEFPTAMRGTFDETFLDLPKQVLISVMKHHQRYFPVQRNGALLPYFIAVRNGGTQHLDVVIRGNAQVIQARFADAAYFIHRDLETPLEDFLPQLASLTFQTDLGSMLDKTGRVEKLTDILSEILELPPDARRVAARAAHLCKADLTTKMVVEMTSLQGEMGRIYARRAGEPEDVAEAIFEHYLPRYAGDRLPETLPGLTVGLADRLDTLMGLFAAGLQPSGARDPFALRRAAIGLVQILTSHAIRFDLRIGLKDAAAGLPIAVAEDDLANCLAFIVARQQAWMLAEGHRHDAVEAVLAAQGHDPAGSAQAVPALEEWIGRTDWDEILQAYARCVRITRGVQAIGPFSSKHLREEAERQLHQALETAEKTPRGQGSVPDLFNTFMPLIPPITQFFDDVLVMDEDLDLRMNRLALLQRIVELAEGVADLSKLEGF
jgi:glycyl-tRNA synthetase